MSDEKKETQGAAENQKLSTKENILQTVKFALFSASAGIIQIATYTLFYEACHFKEWIAILFRLFSPCFGILLSTANSPSNLRTMSR